MCSQTQLPFKNDQRMSQRAAGDKMEDVTESERRIIREPLILGHLSPHPPSHFYPLICLARCVSNILFLFHMVITHLCQPMRTTMVSRGGELPQGQEQKVSASSVSCHVMYH